MLSPEPTPAISEQAHRLLDAFGENVRTRHGLRARNDLSAYISALETENAVLREAAAEHGDRAAQQAR